MNPSNNNFQTPTSSKLTFHTTTKRKNQLNKRKRKFDASLEKIHRKNKKPRTLKYSHPLSDTNRLNRQNKATPTSRTTGKSKEFNKTKTKYTTKHKFVMIDLSNSSDDEDVDLLKTNKTKSRPCTLNFDHGQRTLDKKKTQKRQYLRNTLNEENQHRKHHLKSQTNRKSNNSKKTDNLLYNPLSDLNTNDFMKNNDLSCCVSDNMTTNNCSTNNVGCNDLTEDSKIGGEDNILNKKKTKRSKNTTMVKKPRYNLRSHKGGITRSRATTKRKNNKITRTTLKTKIDDRNRNIPHNDESELDASQQMQAERGDKNKNKTKRKRKGKQLHATSSMGSSKTTKRKNKPGAGRPIGAKNNNVQKTQAYLLEVTEGAEAIRTFLEEMYNQRMNKEKVCIHSIFYESSKKCIVCIYSMKEYQEQQYLLCGNPKKL